MNWWVSERNGLFNPREVRGTQCNNNSIEKRKISASLKKIPAVLSILLQLLFLILAFSGKR